MSDAAPNPSWTAEALTDMVKPETPLEQRICADPEWQVGAAWGAPRWGHPEGAVALHVRDVLANVEQVAIDRSDRERLRLIAIVHDACKGSVDTTLPKTGENHHAMRARRFMERYSDDAELLDVIELHDDGYIAWRHGIRTGEWAEAERRANLLLDRLGQSLPFFLRFYQADNETDGKINDHRVWFIGLAERRPRR